MVSTFANRNLTTNRKNHNFGYGLVFFGSVSGFGSVMCSPSVVCPVAVMLLIPREMLFRRQSVFIIKDGGAPVLFAW